MSVYEISLIMKNDLSLLYVFSYQIYDDKL